MAESSEECRRLPASASADELKRELQRRVNSIIEDADYSIEDTDEAMHCLSALKELKVRPTPPLEYLCPLSHQLMKDPVVLASGQQTYEQMVKLDAVSCLLSIIKEDTSDKSKEHCIAILHTLCYNDRTRLQEMWRDESVNGTIANLALNGTTRAKRKAKEIVEQIDKYFSGS
uniref:RING-type E3 ubiquitin transferase n=1 Tax=Solanum tuberosum TaxID=4113 RepID=M0ZZM1_SOLTU